MKQIDPLTLARFMVLPGAPELVEAFSAIPPGPLRDSVVSHAQVIAGTYTSAPAENQMPDPLRMAADAAVPPRRVTEAPLRIEGARKTVEAESPEGKAVALRLQGVTPAEIAKRLKMPPHAVSAALKLARNNGVTFQAVPHGRKREAEPDRAFATSLDQLTGQGMAGVERAAVARRITPTAYMARRALAVEMAKAGKSKAEIVKATKETEKVIINWLVGMRRSGMVIPYEGAAEAEAPAAPPAPTPAPAPAPVYRFTFPAIDLTQSKAVAAVKRAADNRGMTVEDYLARRNEVVDLRMKGKGGREIARLTGESEITVKDLITLARAHGAVFPPITKQQETSVQ